MSHAVDISSTSTAPYSHRSSHNSNHFYRNPLFQLSISCLRSHSAVSLNANRYGERSAAAETNQSLIETTSGTTSLERRACRICQSETGEMVRPCGCTGTMGDIHDTCLSKWVSSAPNPNQCEICKETYCKSGYVYRPLKEWTRPSIDTSDIVSLMCTAGLIYSIWYLVMLFPERHFADRVMTQGYPIRADDLGRITFLVILLASLFGITSRYFHMWRVYIARQKCIKFVNKTS